MEHFKSYIKDYFINISLDDDVISIVIYNMILLDNIRYEIDLDINDMKNLSQNFNNMNLKGIYNTLVSLISQGKLKLEKQFNDIILSFIIGDIGVQSNYNLNNRTVQLILFGEKDPNEYLNVLTDEIKKLKNQLNQLRSGSQVISNNQSNMNNNQINQNNQNINNNNNNNMPQLITPNSENEFEYSKEFLSSLNVEIYEGMNELKIDKKLIDDRIFPYLNNYQLNNLTKLSLNHNKIVSLNGIEKSHFYNLEELFLNNNNIKDITNLSKANFPKLNRIFLFGNEIVDISPLANSNFPKLNILSLSKNEIININPLRNFNFPQLRTLILDNNEINDISVFQYTNFKLEKLALNDNKIINISVFESANFRDLTHLYLYNNSIVDASPLSRTNFQNLRILSMGNNKIKNISFLENSSLRGLKQLFLSDNQISDISVFTRINIGLEKLDIEGNSFNINNNAGIIQSLKQKIGQFNYVKS